MMKRSTVAITAVLAALLGQAQMNVSTALTPEQLVQDVLLGGGITVSNVTYNGWVVAQPQAGSGSFTNGSTTNLGLNAGVILSSGLATSASGAEPGIISDQTGTGSDPDLLAITTGSSINDKAVLEFDFIPTGDSLNFNYVFASEEHPNYDCSPDVNDVFGFFLSGPGLSGPYGNNAINIAKVPGSELPVSIGNIHGGQVCPAVNEEYYVNNTNGTSLVFGGFTTVLQAQAQVVCGATYHIKLAIGDAGDDVYNSAVFLEAGSFHSNTLPTLSAATLTGDGNVAESCQGSSFTVIRPEGVDTTVTVSYFLGGTATSGTDYTPLPNPIIIPEGQNSVTLDFMPLEDGIAEGPESAVLSVYLVNACGDTLSNSISLNIIDYAPLEITTENLLQLHCDQDSIPLIASYTGGYGNTQLMWGDSAQTGEIWVPGKEDGDYTVSLSDDCPNQVTEEIHVDAGCEVLIPNVLTPNGDGNNDKFVVKGILGKDNRVQIFDRWGHEVLNTTNYRNNFSAQDLHDGVYFYDIRVLEKQYTGHLTVLGSK
jgi:gliding motility-associated-like protein